MRNSNQATNIAKTFLTENLNQVEFGETRSRAFTLVTPFKYMHSNGQKRSGSIFVENEGRYNSKLIVKITMNTTTSLSDATAVQRTLRKAFDINEDVTFDSKSITRLKKVQAFVESEFKEAEDNRNRQKARKEETDNLTTQLVDRGFEFENSSSYSRGKGYSHHTKTHGNQIEMRITTTDVELAAKIKQLLDAQGQ